jgi:hypothetical protein
MEQKENAKLVAKVVEIPTGLAYTCISLGFVTAGIILYTLFMAAAFKIKLFEGLQRWPTISKLAVLGGPALIALGFYFSTVQTRRYMVVPLLVYLLITNLGRLVISLRSKELP